MAGKTQMDFFDGFAAPRCDGRLHPDERPRLNRQSLEILAALQSGPKTNIELTAITHRFSARFYDLRQAGYVIELVSMDYKAGLRTYRLAEGTANADG